MYEDVETETKWICGFCSKEYHKGQVFPIGEKFYNAEWAFKLHKNEHDIVEEILKLPRTATGLTEVQEVLIPLLHAGLKDEEIASRMKISESTVRNHRFRLREKEKQARMFLAVMEKLHLKHGDEVEPHRGATMLDDRYQTDRKEQEKILKTYFNDEGALLSFPAREKKKIVVLRKISTYFKEGVTYSEKEVNKILSRVYEDHVLLRRYLIEYGFLDRTRDGAVYFLK